MMSDSLDGQTVNDSVDHHQMIVEPVHRLIKVIRCAPADGFNQIANQLPGEPYAEEKNH